MLWRTLFFFSHTFLDLLLLSELKLHYKSSGMTSGNFTPQIKLLLIKPAPSKWFLSSRPNHWDEITRLRIGHIRLTHLYFNLNLNSPVYPSYSSPSVTINRIIQNCPNTFQLRSHFKLLENLLVYFFNFI